MSILNRTAVAVSALALAAAPAALGKGGPPAGHGNGHGGGNASAGHGKGHQKAKNVVAKGTVVSYDATAGTLVVQVTKANHHGAGLVGTAVSFDVSAANVTVADTNGDGKTDANDLAVGDEVVVQTVNVAAADGLYAARHVVDQTNAPTIDGPDSSDASDETTPTS